MKVEYCIKCGHYYDSNETGQKINCGCDCHDD